MDRRRVHELVDAFADEQLPQVMQLLCGAYALAFGRPAPDALPAMAPAPAAESPGEEDVLFYIPGGSRADAKWAKTAAPKQVARPAALQAVELPGEEDVLFYIPGQGRETAASQAGSGGEAIELPDEEDVLFCARAMRSCEA